MNIKFRGKRLENKLDIDFPILRWLYDRWLMLAIMKDLFRSPLLSPNHPSLIVELQRCDTSEIIISGVTLPSKLTHLLSSVQTKNYTNYFSRSLLFRTEFWVGENPPNFLDGRGWLEEKRKLRAPYGAPPEK